MAIRPVDLQLLVHKTVDTNRTEQGEARRPEVAHQQFSQVMQKHAEAETHQVIQSNKAEQADIEKDGSGQNKYERRKKSGKSSGEKPAKSAAKQEGISMFDVTV
ncbi:MAG: hypothetical protein LBS21_13495 [Clostridiales bacterium]|jgi:hypothetical protein|nr:hypothetical protein [Clostridiales bacterium]